MRGRVHPLSDTEPQRRPSPNWSTTCGTGYGSGSADATDAGTSDGSCAPTPAPTTGGDSWPTASSCSTPPPYASSATATGATPSPPRGPAHPRHHRPEAGSRRARCRETGTPGSDERPGETTLGNDGTAPPADSYNRLHRVRDVVTGEDRHQLRTANGPQVMAALRNLAISLIRLLHGPAASIAATTRAMARRPRRAIDLITRPPQ